jgi:hypothetical protein
MGIPLLAIFAVLRGPRFRREVTGRDALAAHLEWVRRTGRGPRSELAEDAEGLSSDAVPETPLEEVLELTAEGEPLPLDPAKAFMAVAGAASELGQAWEADVLGSVPSQLMFGMCGIADRAVYLLEEAAPDLALRFEAVRDQLMDHSQGGKPMSDDELGRAVDRLDGLILAVAARGNDMLSAEEDRDGSRLVWLALAQAGCPYTAANAFPDSSAWFTIPRANARAGDVAWWPDYVAICIPAEGGGELLARGRPRLATEEQRRGPPLFYRLRCSS